MGGCFFLLSPNLNDHIGVHVGKHFGIVSKESRYWLDIESHLETILSINYNCRIKKETILKYSFQISQVCCKISDFLLFFGKNLAYLLKVVNISYCWSFIVRSFFAFNSNAGILFIICR